MFIRAIRSSLESVARSEANVVKGPLRMKIRSNLLLLVLALVLSLLTTLLILHRLSNQLQHPIGQTTAQIIVVKSGLGAHQVIGRSDVAVANIPAAALEPGAIRTTSAVIGHYTATAWFPGQQIVSGMVTNLVEPVSFPLLIPLGERAFTIADDPIIGVDHLISPGDHVDILVVYPNQGAKSAVAHTLLQNVSVLYVDNAPVATGTIPSNGVGGHSGSAAAQGSSGKFDTITFALTPKQSEQLDGAYLLGQLHLVLRNPSDRGINALPDASSPNS